jgi:hypothetical protein
MKKTTDNNGIMTFGNPTDSQKSQEAKTETAENKETAKTDANPNSNQDSDNIEVIGDKPKTDSPEDKTKDTDKASEKKNTDSDKSEGKEESKKEKSETDKKETDTSDKEEPFEINFDTKKEKTEPKETEKKQDSASVSEEQVLNFIKQNNPDFKDIKTLADLSKKETLSEPVAKFKEFHEKTGRGIEDFYNLQKDWKNEDQETAIREYFKLSESNITDEDIQLQMDLIRVPNEDEEANFSENELKQRKLDWNKTYRKALNFLQEKTKEFSTPLKNQVQDAPKPPTAEEITKALRPYWDERDKSLNNFNEIKISTSIGDISVPIDEDDKKMISDYTRSNQDFFKDWQDKDSPVGMNTDKVVRGAANMLLFEKIAKEVISQTRSLTLEQLSKENRNVKLDKIKEKQKEQKTGSVETFGGNPDEKNFGEPIMKR